MDEWTDIALRRYLNVTLLGKGDMKKELGLVPITDRCTANNVETLVNQKLQDFGIRVSNHIVCSVHDGAQTMIKYGKQLPAESQLCYVHAIHLAVVSYFYKKKANNSGDTESSSDSSDNEDDGEEGTNEYTLTEEFKPSIDIMRNIINKFRKSPLKSSVLEKYAIQEFGISLKLIADVRTRWNSLVHSIKRFLKLEKCVNKVLREMGNNEVDAHTLEVLRTLLSFVKPLEMAVSELCKDDSNLVKAEGIILYLFKFYDSMDIESGRVFYSILRDKILVRKNKHLVSCLIFLQTGSKLHFFEKFAY